MKTIIPIINTVLKNDEHFTLLLLLFVICYYYYLCRWWCRYINWKKNRQQSSVYNLCVGFESFLLLCRFFVWILKLSNIKRLICVNAKWHASHRIQFYIVLLQIIFVVFWLFVYIFCYVFFSLLSNRLFCSLHAHFECIFF